MNEIIFLVTESPEGGFEAEAIGYSIFTEGDSYDDLKSKVRDAVACHFDQEDDRTDIIRLHWVLEEISAA